MTSLANKPCPSYATLPDNLNPFADRLSETSSIVDTDSAADQQSIMTSPPPYSEAATPSALVFHPTVHLQIETPGKPLLSLPLPPRPDPIPVYDVADPSVPRYVSLRPARGSGSCFLVSPRSPNFSEGQPETETERGEYTPLSTTAYRFGPGRHPRVRLYTPGSATPTSNPFEPPTTTTTQGGDGHSDNGDDGNNMDLSTWDSFPLEPVGLLTRAVTFRTRMGTFRWRYASGAERKGLSSATGTAEGAAVNSLLVLDKVVRVAHAYGSSNTSVTGSGSTSTGATTSRGLAKTRSSEICTPVAHLIRNDHLRSRGSGASSAGNGGRLAIDTSFLWREDNNNDPVENGTNEKNPDKIIEQEMLIVMVVTTALAMLKKEVDRRRAQQIAVMAGAAGGS